MREDIVFEDQPRVQIVKTNGKSSGHPPKPKSSSSWGSQIVKGFVTEKKSKNQASMPSRKPPIDNATLEICIQKNQTAACQSRVKRSLMSDLSINSAQVHPHALDNRLRSPSSHDLFIELDQLRSLLRDSKDRESVLQSQLLQYKENPRVLELEKELEVNKVEVNRLNRRVASLESEKEHLSEQLESLDSILKSHKDSSSLEGSRNMEMEVVALRRLNKELQLQTRNLAYKLSSTESQHAALAKITESEVLAKVQEEASRLRHTNGSLSKQVEDLQMSRLTEVEELAYLRWVNSCLRNELSNSESLSIDVSNIDNDMRIKYKNANKSSEGDNKVCSNQKISKGLEYQAILDKEWIDAQAGTSPRRRHSISGTKGCFEDITVNKRRQSDGFIYSKEEEKDANQVVHQKFEPCKALATDVEKRALRVPKPPPRPSTSIPNPTKESVSIPPPPPPPPPPPKFSSKSNGVMQRAPEVAELYHSLMKRESRKENTSCTTCEANVANVRSSMIDEIENRSSHLLAIKADVETQGEFVNSLIKEVNNAAYQDIEDVVAFVKWLDDELCFLVDERAVLKHFDWPEKKADTLREAAFGYRDLKKLEAEITNYKDDPRIPCDIALKKMVTLSEKMERSVYNLLRTRDAMMRHCKEFHVPTDWMLDNGIVSQIKFASVKLAKKYIKRVASELHTNGASNKDPALEYMLLQGVRFAFRIHQFAGGFDSETMHAFEELRNLAHVRKKL